MIIIPLCCLIFFPSFPWPHALVRTDDLAADRSTLREAGIAADGPALVEFFRKRSLSEERRARLAAAVRGLGDGDFDVRQRATTDLRAAGRLAVPFLREALKDADPEIVHRAEECLQQIESRSEAALVLAAAHLLAAERPAGATRAVLGFLPGVDDPMVEDELFDVLVAVAVQGGKTDSAVREALSARDSARRAAAAWLLGRSADPAGRAESRRLLTDPEPRVRYRAARGLLQARQKEAIPVLVSLLSEAAPDDAWQVEEVLRRLAGDKAPIEVLNTSGEEPRRRARAAWEKWWREQGPDLDLAGIDLERRQLGLTLLVACDVNRVWECGPDGKTRWQLDVSYPIDAQLLPGQRVLVAEQNKNFVTEYDRSGKVVWQRRVTNSLVGCRRLPGGNTFLATYNELLEVDPAGNTVFSHKSDAMIHSAQRLRNGHVAYLSSAGRLIEIDRAGKEVRAIPVSMPQTGLVKFEALPGGHYLVPEARRVVEFDAAGKVVWEHEFANANAVTRLANGNTVMGSYPQKRVVEVARSGRVVWEQQAPAGLLQVGRR